MRLVYSSLESKRFSLAKYGNDSGLSPYLGNLCFPVTVSAFMICRGVCACTEMLWMCVLYVSFGSKVRPRTFGCVAIGSALLCILRSRLLAYSAGSGVNRAGIYYEIVLFCPGKNYVCMVVCISWLHSCLRV